MSLFDDDIAGEEIVGELQEIVGDMGAVGEELDEVLDSVISGTAGPQQVNQLQRLASKMKRLRNIDPSAVAVVSRQNNRRRYWHAPFPNTAFTAALTATLQMQPQELYRTERMFIQSNLCQDYQITQLFVGQKNQLLVAGEINGSVFSEVAVRSFLNLDSANVGNTISLTMRNDGLTTTTPRPDLLGTAAV